jgi:hypothetical protein
MDKYEYEQTYGERIIHCPIHNIYGVDGCVACDEEQQEIIIEMTTKCVTCGYTSSEDEFISIPNVCATQSGLVCQTCYDGYAQHRDNQTIASRQLTDLINTDYLD